LWLYGENILEYILGEKYNYFSSHLLILWGASGLFVLAKNTIAFLRVNDGNFVVEYNSSIISAIIVFFAGTPLIFYKQITGAVVLYFVASLSYFLYSHYKYINRKDFTRLTNERN
jgi:hypothetical protein